MHLKVIIMVRVVIEVVYGFLGVNVYEIVMIWH
jgi:hypothetical protein